MRRDDDRAATTAEGGMMKGVTALVMVIGVGALVVACGGSDGATPTGVESGTVGGGGLQAPSCAPDITPPALASSIATPNVLWPPNHKLVPVAIASSVSDECDPNPRCAISSVSSNEPVNGLGDGDTSPDWVVTGASTLLLRAERSGTGTGRVYAVGSTCTDAAGNGVIGYAFVTVPHDQGEEASAGGAGGR
jgi:hypothetical protein